MVDGQKPKRRVNPALLLGGEAVEKKSQPPLVESDSFAAPKAPVRRDFRLPGEKPVGPRKTPPLPGVGSGTTPTPPKPAPVVPPVKEPVAEDAGDDELVVDSATGEVLDAPVGDVAVSDSEAVKPVIPAFPRVGAPTPSGKAPGLPGVVSKPVKEDKVVEDAGAEVSPSVDKPRRQVNPLFLAGEEKEHVGEAVPVKQERMVRPNFILQGERVPQRFPAKPEKKVQPFQALPDGVAKPRAQYARKIDANVEFEEWTDDDSTDTQYGLGGEVDADYVEPQYSKAFHLTERDIIVMRFLARYRYAYTDQLARLVDTMPRTITARLRVLEKRGFVRRQPITERQYLWMTRKAGNLIVDISFPEIRKGAVSYATIAHTIGLTNLGVEFEREAGGKDLLGEGKGIANWVMPSNRWKLGIWGNPEGKTLGEMTVTEREIRQGQLRWRGGRSSKEMRELVSLAAASPEAPELEEGQEGLFVIYGAGGKGGEHIPDLVIARERDENGKPQHLAIELELTAKSNADWKKILRNYRDNGEMYSKIYYFTHKRSISTALQKVNEEVGLGDRLVVRKYVPVNGKMPFWG